MIVDLSWPLGGYVNFLLPCQHLGWASMLLLTIQVHPSYVDEKYDCALVGGTRRAPDIVDHNKYIIVLRKRDV